jgi:hypothetical protein
MLGLTRRFDGLIRHQDGKKYLNEIANNIKKTAP